MPNLACSVGSTEVELPAGVAGCKPYFDTSKYPHHEYEACTAYTVNSAEIALQGFYKLGNNRVGYLADGARHHFETRYWDGPRESVENKVDSWPQTSRLTGNRVSNSVGIVSVSSSLKRDRALIRTRENWKVTSPAGKTLLKESGRKDITMCRGKLPGHILHEWFVVKFSREPGFDCIAFDRSHGIDP